jgi:hypothetical protein
VVGLQCLLKGGYNILDLLRLRCRNIGPQLFLGKFMFVVVIVLVLPNSNVRYGF